VSEKRTPTYDLAAFKGRFADMANLAVTGTALKTAAALGFGRREIVEAIQKMESKHFYKSMTAYKDNRSWQDVYYVPYSEDLSLYIKFTADAVTEFRLLSFKENTNA
jgi:motility quorum-sensing regulator/GCU-specific mRNA interferase toxin